MQNINLKIKNMTCLACETKIDNKLKSTPGVLECNVSFSKNAASLSFDEEIINTKDIIGLINSIGYHASLILDQDENIKEISIKVYGMTTLECEKLIKENLLDSIGIKEVKVNLLKLKVEVVYIDNLTSIDKITKLIDDLGYETGEVKKIDTTLKPINPFFKVLGLLIILLISYITISTLGIFDFVNIFPTADASTGYLMLFVIGLLTSFHCVAMCGGINISVNVNKDTKTTESCTSDCSNCNKTCSKNGKKKTFKSSILYNLGRVISYTAIGALVGGLGSILSFSDTAKGIVMIIASIFMIIMGLNMFGSFSFLKKITPRLPKSLNKLINTKKSNSKSELIVGLLNGFMPCGPLTAMQIYALSTGSIFLGALSMFLFSLGTVPLMFLLGIVSSHLTTKFAKTLTTASAILVMLLGMFMLSNGTTLAGVNFLNFTDDTNILVAIYDETTNTQTISFDLETNKYKSFKVKKGIPVILEINATTSSLTSCNNELRISKFKISQTLTVGINTLYFTPTELGTISYSCWMGMIKAKIIVIN
ncbi:MAG: sulfite exporter TauE/SafE family protein [Acholeplasmatales bacterium]|jgi:sulfite exporter TauE/SafE/copper chaperone CopZ|nr:sulfite exporter TauE/SafE family protein [Acholeplasmatales bacterium]